MVPAPNIKMLLRNLSSQDFSGENSMFVTSARVFPRARYQAVEIQKPNIHLSTDYALPAQKLDGSMIVVFSSLPVLFGHSEVKFSMLWKDTVRLWFVVGLKTAGLTVISIINFVVSADYPDFSYKVHTAH